MLDSLDMSSIDQLIGETVPEAIKLNKKEFFTMGKNQLQGVDSGNIIMRHLTKIAEANKINKSYQGQGYYPSILPPVI